MNDSDRDRVIQRVTEGIFEGLEAVQAEQLQRRQLPPQGSRGQEAVAGFAHPGGHWPEQQQSQPAPVHYQQSQQPVHYSAYMVPNQQLYGQGAMVPSSFHPHHYVIPGQAGPTVVNVHGQGSGHSNQAYRGSGLRDLFKDVFKSIQFSWKPVVRGIADASAFVAENKEQRDAQGSGQGQPRPQGRVEDVLEGAEMNAKPKGKGQHEAKSSHNSRVIHKTVFHNVKVDNSVVNQTKPRITKPRNRTVSLPKSAVVRTAHHKCQICR